MDEDSTPHSGYRGCSKRWPKYESTVSGTVDVVAVLGGGINHSFDVNENNKLVDSTCVHYKLPTSLTFNMEGKGCAVLQSVLRYNVYRA